MTIRVRAACALVVVVVVSGAASAGAATPTSTAPTSPQTSFTFTSELGDPVGGGQSRTFTSPATSISITGDRRTVSMNLSDQASGGSYLADFAAGAGDTLHPGRYERAESFGFQKGRAPGLNVLSSGGGCSELWGGFTVNQIAFDTSDNLTMVDLSFIQHCTSPEAPALRGTIRLDYLPLSYTQASQRGDTVDGGVTKTYYNGSSVFRLGGGAETIFFIVSGLRDDWTVILTAPTGTQFVAGRTYPANRFGDATHAGVSVGGDSHGCGETSGTVTIQKMSFAGDDITRLRATFVQHCDGEVRALTGTIRYFD